MSDGISIRLRRLVIQRARGICEYCLIHQSDACFTFHIDHIVSRKQRGRTHPANLALSCLRCNVAKGTDPGTSSSAVRRVSFACIIRAEIAGISTSGLLQPKSSRSPTWGRPPSACWISMRGTAYSSEKT